MGSRDRIYTNYSLCVPHAYVYTAVVHIRIRTANMVAVYEYTTVRSAVQYFHGFNIFPLSPSSVLLNSTTEPPLR